MKRGPFLVLLTALGAVRAASGTAEAKVSDPVLAAALAKRKAIKSLTVLHLRDDLMTRSALDPARLGSYEGVKTRRIADNATIEAFFDALQTAHPKAAAVDVDTRWGVLCESAFGKTMVSVYTDKFGRNGQIDGARVHFSNDTLIAFLRSRFA